MKKHLLYTAIAFFLLPFFVTSQVIEWQNTIGGNNIDPLYSIFQTYDGGYILGGWSFSDSSGDKTEDNLGITDYWIVKTDAAGNIEWENTIGGNIQEYMHTVEQTSDGGYIIAGHSDSDISGDKTENSYLVEFTLFSYRQEKKYQGVNS